MAMKISTMMMTLETFKGHNIVSQDKQQLRLYQSSSYMDE